LNNQIVSDNFEITKMPKFSATAVAAAVAGTKHAATGAPLKSPSPSKIAKRSVDALKYAAGGHDSGATILSIYPAREGSFKIVMATKNGKTIFMAPFLNLARDHPEILQDEINCICICNIRDYNHPTSNLPLLVNPNNDFPSKVFLIAVEDGESDDETGAWLAPKFQALMNNHDCVRGNRNRVIYSTPGHLREQGPMPVHHWLQDLDMLRMIKNVYGGDFHTTLEDIMQSEDILLNFFSTVEEGRAFLGRMTEDQWQNLHG
jgi:hypothetical protein